MRPGALLLAAMLPAATAASAQSDIDEALGGFDEAFEGISIEGSAEAVPDSGWRWHGGLGLATSHGLRRHSSSTGTAHGGPVKLRGTARLGREGPIGEHWRLSVEARGAYDLIYTVRDRAGDGPLRDAMETELTLSEAWIGGRLGRGWSLRVGRQVINWGFADSLRVRDIINPLDNREPGLADIEDLRLPLGLLRVERESGPWQLSLLAIPEIRLSRNPPYGSDFHALVNAAGQALRHRSNAPDSLDTANWAIALEGRFRGWDLSLDAARLWLDRPVLDAAAFRRDPPQSADDPLPLRIGRVNTLGAGLQFTHGSWLFKSEARALFGLLTLAAEVVAGPNDEPQVAPSGNPRRDRHDLLLGAEYFGLADTAIAIELAGRRFADFDPAMQTGGESELITESALRISRSLLNERLRLLLVAVRLDQDGRLFGARGGGVYRVGADYELGRNLELSGGLVFYQGGELPPFTVAAVNDRLYLDIDWRF